MNLQRIEMMNRPEESTMLDKSTEMTPIRHSPHENSLQSIYQDTLMKLANG